MSAAAAPSQMNRRRFVQVSALAGGGLMVAVSAPAMGLAKPWEPGQSDGTEVTGWLLVHPDDSVTIRVAKSEMGEGVFTALPMIVAEELGCDWNTVRAEYASANRNLREDSLYQRMGTGGSRSVRGSVELLQQAGASARQRLVAAAAQRWQANVADCSVRDGRIAHADGRELGFGEVAADAAKISLAEEPALKDPSEFTLLGTSQLRLDVPAKTDGSAIFGLDVRVPGMVYAAIRQCPVFGGSVRSFDAAAAKQRRGVVDVVQVENSIAVVAEHWWQAKTALDEVVIDWDEGDAAQTSSAGMLQAFVADLDEPGAVAGDPVGDFDAVWATAPRRLTSDYNVPFLAHACMEPLNCTAHVQSDRVDVWMGAQNPESILAVAAGVSGVDQRNVHVHNCYLGGGFGRRSYPDVARQAVLLSKQIGKPVQLIWSREEDTQQGRYRPMAAHRFDAALDRDGNPVGFRNRGVAQSILVEINPDNVPDGIDRTSVEGLANQPYAFANSRIEARMHNTHVPVWFWRSVGSSQNGFMLESFMDEIAQASGADPVEMRRKLLAEHPHILRVLNELAERSKWVAGEKLPMGQGRGIAIHESFGSICGQVADVSVSRDGDVRVERMVTVLDCGHVVNPLTVEEQVESSIVYGLTAALHGEVEIEAGRAVQSNFHDYPMLRMAQMPECETYLSLSREKWGGVGEPALPTVAPAVTNAIFAAIGRRVRSLPLVKHDLSWS